jgi:hypothetical protein
MGRRDKVGGKSAKTPRPKTLKHRDAPKIQRRGISLATGEETNVEQLTRELAEAREREAATAEVLKVISSTPGELEPVFKAMLENAVRICGAKFGNLFLCEGDAFRAVAFHGAPRAYVEERQRNPVVRPGPATGLGRAMTTKRPVQIPDIQNYEPDSFAPGTTGVKFVRLTGARTVLTVPMLKESELVGAIVIYRLEVRPFIEKQIELVQNFAAQAVIAIENTRLLNELRQRTDDLTESLEQQTATSEVLQVISSSPGDLRPVFATMLANAVRICEAKFGVMHLYEEGAFHVVAMHNVPPAFAEERRNIPIVRPSPGTGLGRAAHTKQVVQIPDLRTYQTYQEREPVWSNLLGRVRFLSCRCLKRTRSLAPSPSIARKFARSLISRSRCSQTSPHKPSSPSRTHVCSMS